MKNYVHILMLTLLSFNINAQTPQGFNYQATVRNSEEALIANANVYFKFNVLQGSQTAVPVFTEIHYIATDDLGQVNLIIGEGTATEGTFSQIDWSLGNYYLGVEINTGQSYVAMGTTQLLSVPYALYAANSGNATPSTTLGSVLSVNNSADQQQIKNLLDPTDGADAVTKSYADALSKSSGLMNYNGWDNYQVWNDNTTVQLEPNSFTYVNANQTTLVFPEAANNCCVGSVIYVYVMQGDNTTPLDFVLQPSGLNVAIHSGVDLVSTATEQFQGQFQTGGLQTIVNVGDYWMVGNFKVTETITDIDNNPYDYLTYGKQVWTVENAAMETYRDGTPIPQVTDATEWSNLTTGAWGYFNNDPTKHRFYNWFAVMGMHDTDESTPNKEFAPEGWHVPSDAEWTTLENHLVANGYNYDGTTTENKIAKAMASTIGWGSSTNPGAVGNDQSLNKSSGFNAFPEGSRNHDGLFLIEGLNAVFWSSTEHHLNTGWDRNLSLNTSSLGRFWTYGQNGMSVRFVKD